MLYSQNTPLPATQPMPRSLITRRAPLKKSAMLLASDSGPLAIDDALAPHNLGSRKIEDWRIAARSGGASFSRVSNIRRAGLETRRTVFLAPPSPLRKGGEYQW